MHTQAWGMVNDFMAEMAPTWSNIPKKRKADDDDGCFAHSNYLTSLDPTSLEKGKTVISRHYMASFCAAASRANHGLDWNFPIQGEPDLTGNIISKLDPWLDATLSGMNNGLRRRDSEQVVIYVNMPCAGVVSSAKNMFCISEVTRLLHQHPRTGIAVIVLPNRAGDLRSTKILGLKYLRSFRLLSFL